MYIPTGATVVPVLSIGYQFHIFLLFQKYSDDNINILEQIIIVVYSVRQPIY